MPGFSGKPCVVTRIIKTFQLAMAPAEFENIRGNFTAALATVFAVQISDIEIEVVSNGARRRLLAQGMDVTVLRTTITTGNNTTPPDGVLAQGLAVLGFAVTIVPNVEPTAPVSSTNGGIFSIFSMLGIFGDNLILQIAVICVCVICVGALLSCLQQISGAKICCSFRTSNCLKTIKLGCLYCRCFCSNKPFDHDSDDDNHVVAHVSDEQDEDDDEDATSRQNKRVHGSKMFIYHTRPHGYQNVQYC
jgi:hypothetical protein